MCAAEWPFCRLSNIDLTDINRVIFEGESGPNAMPMKEEWVLIINERCLKSKVPFFFKQLGGFNKKKFGRLLECRTWDQFPMLESPDKKDIAESILKPYSE